MLCVCNFSKPIKGYILRMIRKARLVRATVDAFTYRVSSCQPQNDFCCFEALTGPSLHYLLNCKDFVLIFAVLLLCLNADLTGKGNHSLNSENIADCIWFNFILKIRIQRCYEYQSQNDLAVSKLWLDRPYNVKLKVFCVDFVSIK